MDTRSNPLKKRDMGIAGAIIVLSQVISNFQSSKSISEEFKDLKNQFIQLQLDQEKYFVKKSDMKKVVSQLDKMNEELSKINDQIESIRDTTAFLEPFDDQKKENSIIGCVHKKPLNRGI